MERISTKRRVTAATATVIKVATAAAHALGRKREGPMGGGARRFVVPGWAFAMLEALTWRTEVLHHYATRPEQGLSIGFRQRGRQPGNTAI